MDQPHGSISGGQVEAEAGNPSADLIASWLSVRLGVPFAVTVSGGPGITSVSFDTSDGEVLVTRPDGRVAVLRRPGEPERKVALHRRDTAELLAEELRRLDPDDVYGETIAPFLSATPAGVSSSLDGSGSNP
jgi:glucose-6-phosphate dehydrogenase assembly protein OpcA